MFAGSLIRYLFTNNASHMPICGNAFRVQAQHVSKSWLLFFAESFAYIDNSNQALLTSPRLPWKQFHKLIGICLRFAYLMPRKASSSNLKVFLLSKDNNRTLLWELFGFHGENWTSKAEVSWSGKEGTQVMLY